MYQKILIANRGEIAVRIIRACRELGIATVAVCSTADQEALHAQLADECICVGPPRPAESYLNMEQVLSAALVTGAQAVHPGFGFLSENTKFARMCQQCGIDFIGPSPECIEKMGDKSEARKTMIAAGVPVIPGMEEATEDAEAAQAFADTIGYPVMIKASAGGGGKGMREAASKEEFVSQFAVAQREARQSFGDGRMYVEKLLYGAHHIEFQVMGDKSGTVIQLGERDCTIQRRHQKMIEETPSPFLKEETRRKMGKAAVRAAKAAGYWSAGTVEFLVDDEQNFYFMEMNTRIQVEHPVTELVTGVDLVKQMILISAGEALSYRQSELSFSGHAIECRITAEDPEHRFLPNAGRITGLHLPGGNGVRVDTALYQGCEVPPFYDSMLAKLIVHAPTRDEAIRKMRSTLGELVIEGITTNVDFLYELVGSVEFAEADVNAINEILEQKCECTSHA